MTRWSESFLDGRFFGFSDHFWVAKVKGVSPGEAGMARRATLYFCRLKMGTMRSEPAVPSDWAVPTALSVEDETLQSHVRSTPANGRALARHVEFYGGPDARLSWGLRDPAGVLLDLDPPLVVDLAVR